MFTLPRLTARLAVVASFAALLAAACNPDSKGPSTLSGPTPTLSASHSKDAPTPSTGSALGVAGNFTILGRAAVTCTNGTITGNVGDSVPAPAGAITLTICPLTGGTAHIGDAAAMAAYNAFLAAYTALAPKVGDCDAAHTLLSTITGPVTLAPGVYCTGAALTGAGVLTLSGPANATWLFKIGTGGTGALTGTGFNVVMAGGANACNVTWWVSQAVTMTDSDLKGTILAGAGITLTRGTLIGRAFSKAGATVTGTAVTGCVGSTPPGGGKGDSDDDGEDDGDHDGGDHGHGDKDHDRHHHDKDHDGDRGHDGAKGHDRD